MTKVEHTIGMIKRVFDFQKVSSRGLAKNLQRLKVSAALDDGRNDAAHDASLARRVRATLPRAYYTKRSSGEGTECILVQVNVRPLKPFDFQEPFDDIRRPGRSSTRLRTT